MKKKKKKFNNFLKKIILILKKEKIKYNIKQLFLRILFKDKLY